MSDLNYKAINKVDEYPLQEITKEIESGFRSAVKNLAKVVYGSNSKMKGWSSSEKPENYSGATPYFDD